MQRVAAPSAERTDQHCNDRATIVERQPQRRIAVRCFVIGSIDPHMRLLDLGFFGKRGPGFWVFCREVGTRKGWVWVFFVLGGLNFGFLGCSRAGWLGILGFLDVRWAGFGFFEVQKVASKSHVGPASTC